MYLIQPRCKIWLTVHSIGFIQFKAGRKTYLLVTRPIFTQFLLQTDPVWRSPERGFARISFLQSMTREMPLLNNSRASSKAFPRIKRTAWHGGSKFHVANVT